MRSGGVLAGVLALAACGSEAPDAGPAERASTTTGVPWDGPAPRHVLVLSIDTLRADRLGCYGHPLDTSPAIDRLARQGARFEHAQVPRGATWPTLTSVLTGVHPVTHGVRRNGVIPGVQRSMLFRYLRDAGYTTGAFLCNFDDALTASKRRGLDKLTRGRTSRTRDQSEWDRRATAAAIEWLEEHREDKTFTWLHLMNPHRPYEPSAEHEALVPAYSGWLRERVTLDEVRGWIADGTMPMPVEKLEEILAAPTPRSNRAQTYADLIAAQKGWIKFDQLLDWIVLADLDLSDADLGYILGRYDGEIRGSDARIGEVLAALERLELTDDTLIVFTSDHGEELYDHNRYLFHGSSIYQGTVAAPLIFCWPGQIQPGVQRELVDSMDILPTVLEFAGVALPEDLEGASLVGLLTRGEGFTPDVAITELYHQHAEAVEPPLDAAYSIRTRRWKLIVNSSGAHHRAVPYVSLPGVGFRLEREELYDLDRDPEERADVLRSESVIGPDRVSDAAAAMAAAAYLSEATEARLFLFAEFESWLRERGEGDVSSGEISEELREELASLGYVDESPDAHSGALETPSVVRMAGAQATLVRAAMAALGESADGMVLLAEASSRLERLDEAREAADRARELARPTDRSEIERRLRNLGLPE